MALQKRSGIYHSRVNVPSDLRPLIKRREVVKSLRTADHTEARIRSSLWECRVYKLLSDLRSNARNMDRDAIEALVSETLDAELHEIEERLALDLWRLDNRHLGDEWNQTAREVLGEKVDGLQEALAENDLTGTLEDARRMAPDLSEGSQRILARRLLEVKLEACLAEMRALEGLPLRRGVIVPRSPEALKKVTSPLLSELVRLYVESKLAGGKWTGKTKQLTEARLLTMVDLIGDKRAHSVTSADMRAVQTMLPRVLTGYRMSYPGQSATQAIERADADGREDRLSAKTQNMHIVDIKSLFKWAVKQELLLKSPASAIEEVKDDSEGRKPFTDEDLRAIFGTLREDAKGDAARWWVPHVLLFTGARLEEVCQLHAEDVRQEHGVWFLDINRDGSKRLKTDNSERLVPVHSRLIALGWLDYVKSVGKGHLFPSLEFRGDRGGYSGEFSKWAGRRLRKVGIADTRKVASHSFRHTMATRLGSAGVSPQIIDRLQGWADSSMRANYTHAPEAKALGDAMEKFESPI
jgi:integrase